MTASLTMRLRQAADEVWRAQHEHSFVRAIGAGNVDIDQFRHWLKQDYLFLVEYSRLFALATARAPDLATMRVFARLAQETLEIEMGLHRTFVAQLGISERELSGQTMAPTTRAYTDFLLRTAALRDYVELVAALLPCMWGFNEIGLSLKGSGLPQQPQCRQWVEMYASPEFTQLTEWCREVLDRLGTGMSAEAAGRVEEAFLTSSRYELLFWEMAEKLETWRI
jgi:thiaminase/transcriptional activator TenA